MEKNAQIADKNFIETTENFLAQDGNNNADASRIAQALLDFNNMNDLSSEKLQATIIQEFNAKKLDAKQNINDKINDLVDIVAHYLPANITLENISIANPSALNGNIEHQDIEHAKELENYYARSLLSDLVNKSHSAITERLRSDLLDANIKFLSQTTEGEKTLNKEEINEYLKSMIDEPLEKLAKGLNLVRERSFLERLL